MAGLIDALLLSLLMAPVAIAPVLTLEGNDTINASISYTSPRGFEQPVWVVLAAAALTVVYYAVLEGRWGRSLGKLVCGLELTAKAGGPAGAGRAFGRALLFALPYWMVIAFRLAVLAAGGPHGAPAPGWNRIVLFWGSDSSRSCCSPPCGGPTALRPGTTWRRGAA
jgi:uncharacterized RDD family membrane protein YckC